MKSIPPFRTRHLVGRPPTEADHAIYTTIFGPRGLDELQRNSMDMARHGVAPWTLSLGGQDVGVGGFRIGFGSHEGFELTLSLVPGLRPVGLAGEFLRDAILFVEGTLRSDRVFTFTDSETTLSARLLGDAGFVDDGPAPIPGRSDRRILRWTSTGHTPTPSP
jgi:RimJ/RimL family protein N-acetyltransferase